VIGSSLKRCLVCGGASAAILGGAAQAGSSNIDDLRQLSIEELANIEVTSVSKRAEPLSAAPAAIYVITHEDIRRFGAKSLPEALRLAPNLQVARLDALSHAISARGFNSTEASNKLLVLIDGRSVYSPLHSGVFWDAQDVMLEDIERIEVVGGPGGTLWGANAVNGVINVITKSAAATHGGLVAGNYGTTDRGLATRYGGAVGESLDYRFYVKAFERGHSRNPNGTNHIDDWNRVQGGFKVDWRTDRDSVTLQGDFYGGDLDAVVSEVVGQNVVLNWSHDFAGGSPVQVLAYYDRTHRDQPGVLVETVETYNLELQHGFSIGDLQQITYGGGYRRVRDSFDVPAPFDVVNASARLQLGHVFIQDEVALTDTLKITAGIKIEHHTYTGFEYMPNVRVAWQPSETDLWWGSVSRAVRTPSRLDRELTALPILLPAPDFASETLVAYEAGYRGAFGQDLTLSISGFYNVYDDLRTTSLLSSPTGVVAKLQNGMEGDTYGVEIWGQYSLTEWWRLSAGASFLEKNLRAKPGVIDASNMQAAGNDPSRQFSLHSLMRPIEEIEFDVGLRVVEDLTSPPINGYTELDMRLGLHVADGVELSVAAFNLLNNQHPEGGPPATRREIRRSYNAGLTFSF